jgi:predicted phage tail protein
VGAISFVASTPTQVIIAWAPPAVAAIAASGLSMLFSIGTAMASAGADKPAPAAQTVERD